MTSTAGDRTVLRRLLALLGRERGWMIGGILLALLSTLSGIALLAVAGHFITAMAIAGVSGAAINYFTPAALIRLFAILRTGGRYAERLITHEATLRALADMRVWLFSRLVPLAPARLGALRSSELFSRLRGDIDALEHAYLAVLVPMAVALVACATLAGVFLLYLPPLAPVLIVLFVAGGIALPAWTLRRSAGPGETDAASGEALRALTADGIRGRAELALYGAEHAHARRIAELTDRRLEARRRMETLQALGGAGVAFAAQAAMVAALLIGVPALAEGDLAPPVLTMLVLLAQAAFEPVVPLPQAWAQMASTLASARRIFALADTPPAVADPVSPAPPPETAELRVRDLRLRYGPDRDWVLDGVDFDLPVGRRLAVTGTSGAGKSSLINALLRLYDFDGQILLGGRSLKDLTGDAVRARIAVVEQQPYLFDTTLRENLRLGRPDAPDKAIEDALARAQLSDYITRLPKGLDTWVGEGGVRVSGGEARRIAIARALLLDAPILILDEPTEGLDASTADALYRALANAMQGRSVLMITHRLGGLARLVDDVAVMEAGKLRWRDGGACVA